MSNRMQKKIRDRMALDRETRDIAWDKGKPNYLIECEAKTFRVKNLTDWCEFYDVPYQSLMRVARENLGDYKGIKIRKINRNPWRDKAREERKLAEQNKESE